jgi:hypothetical protein
MSYSAKVYRILIASPSDVAEERDIAVRIIQEWNDLNSAERQLVLLPLKWETHSAPEFGKRPQEIINRQVVDQCDLLVGAFWTRIGSPTGLADSGTLEEIERVAKGGKPIMLYFSKANKNPDEIDLEQLKKLREFKSKTLPNALVENYGNHVEFRDKLARQLEIQLRSLLAKTADYDQNQNEVPNTDIILNFSDPNTGNKIGESIEISATSLEIDNYNSIPDYTPRTVVGREKYSNNKDILVLNSDSKGPDYYRDAINRLVLKNRNLPVRFWLTNQGAIGARDVFIDIRFKSNKGSMNLLSKSDMLRGTGFLGWSSDESFEITKIDEDYWATSFEMRALQPKREVIPNGILYVGANEDCEINVEAKIYADTLSEPIVQHLTINYSIKAVEVEYENLLSQLDDLSLNRWG